MSIGDRFGSDWRDVEWREKGPGSRSWVECMPRIDYGFWDGMGMAGLWLDCWMGSVG